MRLLLGVSSENGAIIDELLQELPADGILGLTPRLVLPTEGMKSGGALGGIIVDLLPGAVEGLFKTIAAFFQRPRPVAAVLVIETPDGKLNLSFDPAQLDSASMAGLVEQVTRALRAQSSPSGTGG